MALALVQAVQNRAGNVATTLDITVTATTAGSTLIFGCGNAVNGNVVSVARLTGGSAESAVTCGAGAVAINTALTAKTEMWWIDHTVGGVTVYRVTWSDVTGGNHEIWFWEYSGFTTPGVDAVGKVDNGVGVLNTDTGAAVTASGSSGVGGAVVIVVDAVTVNPKAGNAWSTGGGSGMITSSSDAGTGIIYSSTGTYTPEWTDNSSASGFCSSSVLIEETAGGSTVGRLVGGTLLGGVLVGGLLIGS